MFGLDGNNRVTFATARTADQLGIAAGAYEGTHVREFLGVENGDAVLAAADAVRGSGRSLETVTLETPTQDHTVSIELTSNGDEIIGSVNRTVNVEQLFTQLLKTVSEPAVAIEMVDLRPIVRQVNHAFVETFGYDAEEVIGNSLNEYLVPDETVAEAVKLDRRTASGKENRMVLSRQTANGLREFEYQSQPFTIFNNRKYAVAVYRDVTADRRSRKQLQVLHRVLRHNLRNGLSVIIGTAEHILDQTNSPPVAESAERIITASEKLQGMSEQSNEVTTALSKTSERPIDVASLVRSVATEANVPVETRVQADAAVQGGVGLQIALQNIVDNSIQHTPADTHVIVRVTIDGDDALLQIIDDGPGIPAVERAAVFDDEEITRLQHGSGLGLWLARWVCEAAGGKMVYERRDGQTVVTLRVPTVEHGEQDALTIE